MSYVSVLKQQNPLVYRQPGFIALNQFCYALANLHGSSYFYWYKLFTISDHLQVQVRLWSGTTTKFQLMLNYQNYKMQSFYCTVIQTTPSLRKFSETEFLKFHLLHILMGKIKFVLIQHWFDNSSTLFLLSCPKIRLITLQQHCNLALLWNYTQSWAICPGLTKLVSNYTPLKSVRMCLVKHNHAFYFEKMYEDRTEPRCLLHHCLVHSRPQYWKEKLLQAVIHIQHLCRDKNDWANLL